MFIAKEKRKKASAPGTSAMVLIANLPRRLSVRAHMTGFVRTGFVPLIIVAIVTTIAVFNSGVQGSSTEPLQSQQGQMQFPANLDYGTFQHSTQYHARLPCLLCHKRDTNAAVPKRPAGSNHLPCAGCHAQQFASSDGPICTICHTDVKAGALKPFPRLRSFNMKFDHGRHLNMGGVGCASCHRPARGGVALQIPTGFNAHANCFRCHTNNAQSGGRDISSCGTCHELGAYARTPQFAQAFRVGFSHADHKDTSCNACHQIRAGLPQRAQVTQPQPLNHHATGRGQSCATCHNGRRAFGGDDFSVCKRCHTGGAWRFGK